MDANDRRKIASEEAADWFVLLQADDLPRSTREQYVDWLRDSPTHLAEMIRIAQVHGALEQFQGWARISTDGPSEDENVIALPNVKSSAREHEAPGKGAARRGVRLFALAATLAAVLVTAIALLPKLYGQVIDTERGERRELVLSDGTVVQVDPQTRLRVKFKAQARHVYLERGRVLFHVAKNANRPFLVKVDDTLVRAVGTAFGVERQKQDIVVTVSEGKVAVLAPSLARETTSSQSVATAPLEEREGKGSRAAGTTKESEVLLTAGQQLTVQRSGSAEPVRKVDAARELAWAEGRLFFENDRVTQVIEELNRYNRVQLHVTDEALGNRPISGVFSASDPESFIAFIQTVAPVSVVRDDEDITISARP